MDMSPHRHVYINYSSALEVMRAQLQMLEKKKKMTARNAVDGTQLYTSNYTEVRQVSSLAPHYHLFTLLFAILHCN